MDKMKREELVDLYRPDVERMAYFLPWLEGKTGKDVTTTYEADEHHATLAFPVYDEILLGFLNELSTTMFMDTNYLYLYSKYRIRTYQEELALIEKADIMTMDILKGILSRYVLGGMTKAYLWTQGIEYKIFLNAVKRAKDIIEFWSVPLDIRTIDMDIAEEQARLEAEQEAAAREAAEAAASEQAVEAQSAAWGEPDAQESPAETAEAAETAMEAVTEIAESVVEATAQAQEPAAEEPAEMAQAAEPAAAETAEATEPATAESAESAAEEKPEAPAQAEEAKPAEPVAPQEVELVRGAEDVLVREEKPKKKPAAKKRAKKTEPSPEKETEEKASEPAEEKAEQERQTAPKKTTRKRKPRKKTEEKPAAEQTVKETEGATGDE